MRWDRLGYDNEVLVNGEGRIVGEISGGSRRFRAFAQGGSLGEYVERADAKRAVERAIGFHAGTDADPLISVQKPAGTE